MSLTEPQMLGLLSAYVERKQFEARVTMSVFGETMKPKEQPMSLAFLAANGFGIRGA